ncbi:MAG: hypothetical protein JNK02_11180 [Planctomycetes bacterium]|nr:hypothetical protein [Planctomycetota bacterium]
MDGLALLCALHADGPQSLRRLRRSGCPSLESVATLDAARLAELLASSPAAAQRFRREAELLLARLGGADAPRREAALLADGLLEAEEEPTSLPAADPSLAESRVTAAEAAPPASGAPAAGNGREHRTALPSAQPWDAALARWRELDALEDAEAAAEPIVEESSAPVPHHSPRTPLTALVDLARESHDALIAAGIVDLEALAACDPLDLARATGLDYSNAVRWRALARRALPEGVERFSRSGLPSSARPSVVPLVDFVLRPAPPRAAELREETAGGPFA